MKQQRNARQRLARLLVSGRVTFGLAESIVVALLAVAISIAGALLESR